MRADSYLKLKFYRSFLIIQCLGAGNYILQEDYNVPKLILVVLQHITQILTSEVTLSSFCLDGLTFLLLVQ